MAAPISLAVHLGRRRTRFVFGEGTTVLREATVNTPLMVTPSSVVDMIATYIVDNAHHVGRSPSDVKKVGVGLSGITSDGVVLRTNHLWPEPNVDLTTNLGLKLHIASVKVVRDVDAAAFAEAQTAFGDFVLLRWGTSVSAGLVMNGQPYHGYLIPGELDHLPVEFNREEELPMCYCGRSGHLGAVASGWAIERFIEEQALFDADLREWKRQHSGGRLSVKHIIAAAGDGVPIAGLALRNAARPMGLAIASILTIINPPDIVLSGGIARAWETHLKEPTLTAAQGYLAEQYHLLLDHISASTREHPVTDGLLLMLREPVAKLG